MPQAALDFGDTWSVPSLPDLVAGAHVGRNSGDNEWYTPPSTSPPPSASWAASTSTPRPAR